MMRQVFLLIPAFAILSGPMLPLEAHASPPNRGVRKKTVYRQHTQLDFSGETIEGKIRAPELFFIFQRKRSGGHNAVTTPASISHHRAQTDSALKQSIPKVEGAAP